MGETRTVCVECIHFQRLDPTSPRADIWHNNLCRASPLPKAIDPYDRKIKPYRINDLGQRYFTKEEFNFCRKINDGNCSLFVKK